MLLLEFFFLLISFYASLFGILFFFFGWCCDICQPTTTTIYYMHWVYIWIDEKKLFSHLTSDRKNHKVFFSLCIFKLKYIIILKSSFFVSLLQLTLTFSKVLTTKKKRKGYLSEWIHRFPAPFSPKKFIVHRPQNSELELEKKKIKKKSNKVDDEEFNFIKIPQEKKWKLKF